MSASLEWRPIKPREQNEDLPTALRFALEKRHPDWSGEIIYGYEEVSYLEGLRDCNVQGAQKLLDLIEQHGAIALWRQY